MLIRNLQESDYQSWRILWRGYIDFYQADVSDEQIELTWRRLLNTEYNEHALVAEVENRVIGIAHYSFQTSTWAPKHYCYLEDLFVDQAARGQGAGRALISAVKEIAINAGSTRIYWNTDGNNQTARALYDSFTQVSEMVQYRISL